MREDGHLQRAFDLLCEEYDVRPEQLQSDMLALVDEMAKAGLVQVR
ncbi:MAG: PqqD family protein [Arenimonas sp.]